MFFHVFSLSFVKNYDGFIVFHCFSLFFYCVSLFFSLFFIGFHCFSCFLFCFGACVWCVVWCMLCLTVAILARRRSSHSGLRLPPDPRTGLMAPKGAKGKAKASSAKSSAKGSRERNKDHENAMQRMRYHLTKSKKDIKKEFKKCTSKQKREWAEKFDRTGNVDFVVTRKTKSSAKFEESGDEGEYLTSDEIYAAMGWTEANKNTPTGQRAAARAEGISQRPGQEAQTAWRRDFQDDPREGQEQEAKEGGARHRLDQARHRGRGTSVKLLGFRFVELFFEFRGGGGGPETRHQRPLGSRSCPWQVCHLASCDGLLELVDAILEAMGEQHQDRHGKPLGRPELPLKSRRWHIQGRWPRGGIQEDRPSPETPRHHRPDRRLLCGGQFSDLDFREGIVIDLLVDSGSYVDWLNFARPLGLGLPHLGTA